MKVNNPHLLTLTSHSELNIRLAPNFYSGYIHYIKIYSVEFFWPVYRNYLLILTDKTRRKCVVVCSWKHIVYLPQPRRLLFTRALKIIFILYSEIVWRVCLFETQFVDTLYAG